MQIPNTWILSNLHNTFFVTAVSFLILFCGCEGKSFRVLNESLSIADVDFRTYKIPYNAKDWTITGRLVVVDPFNACDEIKNGDDLKGNIALVGKYTCTAKNKVERLKEFNVSAIMIFNQQVVAQFAFDDGLSKDDKVCEVFSVRQQDTAKLKKTAKDNVLFIEAVPVTSPWWELDQDGALVFFSVFFLSIEVAGASLAGYKYVCFWNHKDYRWSVPTTALGLLICGFIDPQITRGLYERSTRNRIATLSLPFVMSVSILVAFYWQAAISAVYNPRFLPSKKKFLVPVGVMCGLFMFMEFSRIIAGLASPESSNSYTVGFVVFFVYLIAIVVVALFYIISASRVLWFLRSTKSNQKTTKAKRLTSWLLLSSICYFVVPFILGLTFVPVSADKGALFTFLFLSDTLYHLVQLSLVMAFQAPSFSGETTMERTSSADKPTTTSISTRNEDAVSIELS